MINSFILELDGTPVGRLLSVDMPMLKTDIITQPNTGFRPKQNLSPVVSDVKFRFGTGMSRTFYEWITSPLSRLSIRKHGAIVVLNSKSIEVSRAEFDGALVTAFAVPELDSSSKADTSFLAAFRPERVRYGTAGAKANLGPYGSTASKQWSASNFRFSISGLEEDTAKVSKIGSFGMTQALKVFFMGNSNEPEINPTSVSNSNLSITLPLSSAAGLIGWGRDVVNGNTASKAGFLELLGRDNKTAYFSFEFSDIMFNSTSIAKVVDDQSNKPVTVEMSFNSMKFSAHSTALM